MVRHFTIARLAALFAGAILSAAQRASAPQHAEKAAEYVQAGDLVRAEAELREAVKLAPADASYLTSLGGILGMQQKLQDANVYFERAVKTNPRDPIARRNLAVNQWQLGQLIPAQENLEQVLRLQPNDATAIQILGMVAENLHDYPRAAKLLGSVPSLVDQRPESVAALANAYYRTSRREQAQRLLEDLVGRAADPRSIFSAARVALQAADYTLAEKLLKTIRTTYPDSTTLEYNLAMIQYRTDRVSESQDTLAALVDAGHVSSDIYNLLAWCYQKQKKTSEAVAYLENAIREDPSNASNYLDLARILVSAKKLGAAFEIASRMVEIFPHSEPAYRMKGLILIKTNQFTDAVHVYSRAVKLNPASLDARLGLASAKWAAGMRDDAETAFLLLLKQNPREAVAFETYGTLLLYSATDDATEARAAGLLKIAIGLDNSRAESHFQLGNLVLKKGKSEFTVDSLRQSLEHLETAARLEPAASKIRYALARLYRRLGRDDDATKQMRLYQELRADEDGTDPRETALGMQGK